MAEPKAPSMLTSPFHPAELEIQQRLGVREPLEAGARAGIRDHMPEQHRSFFAQLPFVCIGAVDEQGQPWASVLAGRPGFVFSPDPRMLRINAYPLPDDPIAQGVRAGAQVGLLGIELHTRRRNRMNGEVVQHDAQGFSVRVGQSFGNCPQYIQQRDFRFEDPGAGAVPPEPVLSDGLDAADRAVIAAADTFFIASANLRADAGAGRGVDVSHRGGRPGFVRIDDERTLTVPDFLGNFFFNTLGNLQVEPRAGLVFIDFASGSLLHLACIAEVIWDGEEVRAFSGAERLVRFRVTRVVRRPDVLPLRWSGFELAPQLARTGSWEEASQALEAERRRNQWRRYEVLRVDMESETIRSFVFRPADGAGIPPHAPGQFVPIRVPAGQDGQLLQRVYTVSDAPDGRTLRISVKREGTVSSWLHTHMKAGEAVEMLAPRGPFVFDTASGRPAILLSAGVGITPMIAMLNSLFVNEHRTRFAYPVFLIHGARNGRELAFADHLRDLAARHAGFRLHIACSRPDVHDMPGRTHDSQGRVDINLVRSLLPSGAAPQAFDFYLCGPPAFMQHLYDGLRGLNVPDAQIRFESFGDGAVVRENEARREVRNVSPAQPVKVAFAKSGKAARWHDVHQSLLELAEENGLSPLYGCRNGVCGSCATRVLAGRVDGHAQAPCEAGDALLCVSIPDAAGGELVLDL